MIRMADSSTHAVRRGRGVGARGVETVVAVGRRVEPMAALGRGYVLGASVRFGLDRSVGQYVGVLNEADILLPGDHGVINVID